LFIVIGGATLAGVAVLAWQISSGRLTVPGLASIRPSPAFPADALVSPTREGVSLRVSPVPRPDVPALRRLMLELINQERRQRGLSQLAWDDTAAVVGYEQAHEMARLGYMNHWNTKGYGPDYRYTLAGGLDSVRENVYLYQHSQGGGPQSAADWETFVRDAHQALMASPRHRDNILAPAHTHVGIGMAYRSEEGRFAVAQAFVGRYLTLTPLPRRISVGETVLVSGALRPNLTGPFVELAYQPLPQARSVTDLRQHGYDPDIDTCLLVPLLVDDEGRFSGRVTLDWEGRPGLYHVRIWGDADVGQVLAADVVVEVR